MDHLPGIELPPSVPFKVWLGFEKGYSSVYGALHVAARHCGMDRPPRSFVGIWNHGCVAPWLSATLPKALAYHAAGAESRPVFVARKDEERTLQSNGYSRALAIGLPYAYLPEVDLRRIPGSMLVAPVHDISEGDNYTIFEGYARQIKAVAHHFSRVLVCLHGECAVRERWAERFAAYGFECIRGASMYDANSLLRTRMLISQFEFVTTNDWGSHVAYALAGGAKVSIFGQRPNYTLEALLTDPGFGGDVAGVKQLLSRQTQEEENRWLDPLRTSPEVGVRDVALGEWFIGSENKRPPAELSKLFAWDGNRYLRLVQEVFRSRAR